MLDGWNDKCEYGWIMDVNKYECWMDGMKKVSMDELCI